MPSRDCKWIDPCEKGQSATAVVPTFNKHMARLSKTSKFTILEDSGIPTPDPNDLAEYVEVQTIENGQKEAVVKGEDEQDFMTEDRGDAQEADQVLAIRHQNAEDERRESSITTTSVSSYPESTYPTDNEFAVAKYQPYTPPVIRPSFRRTESIRRMQLASPPPFGSRSPRRSILSHSHSRTGTPRSARSLNARESPRPRKRISEETEGEGEVEQKHYPLVLLHATLLRVDLPWSLESMQELLPAQVLANLQLLRSKVSETVLQRGILIPHPREEYELLEERLLEALELKEERVTKCGHFQGRVSTNLSSPTYTSGEDSDSGLGSSIDGSDGERCATCQHHIKTAKSGVGSRGKKWKIRVFAANGLLRSSAWSAVWPEMERVDVEILPWISDDMRRQLDERREKEEREERERLEDEEERIKEIVDEQVRLAHEEMKRIEEVERRAKMEENASRSEVAKPYAETIMAKAPSSDAITSGSLTAPADLPQIYRPSQIPLSILLKNYVYLLAQDRRNIVMAVLGVIALFFAIRPISASRGAILPSLNETSAAYQPLSSPLAVLANATTELSGRLEEHFTSDTDVESAGPGIETAEADALQDPSSIDAQSEAQFVDSMEAFDD